MVSKLTIVFLTWRNSSIFQRGGGGVKNPAPLLRTPYQHILRLILNLKKKSNSKNSFVENSQYDPMGIMQTYFVILKKMQY